MRSLILLLLFLFLLVTSTAGAQTVAQGAPGARPWPIQTWFAGSPVDPRAIRVLTSGDVVTVVQPTGSNLHIVVDGSVAVTGTFFQATQPVSAINLDIRNLLFATDKVDVSGSSISFTPYSTQASGNLSGPGQVVTLLPTSTLSVCSVTVQNSAFVGTLAFVGYTGTSGSIVTGMDAQTGATSTSPSLDGHVWLVPCGGYGRFDVGVAAYTSGSVDVEINAGVGAVHPPIGTQTVSGTVNLGTISGAATAANQATEITSLQLIDNIVSGTGANVSQVGGTNITAPTSSPATTVAGLPTRPLPRIVTTTGSLLNPGDSLVLALDGQPFVALTSMLDATVTSGNLAFLVSYNGNVPANYTTMWGVRQTPPDPGKDGRSPYSAHAFDLFEADTTYLQYRFEVGPGATHVKVTVNSGLSATISVMLAATNDPIGSVLPTVGQGRNGIIDQSWWMKLSDGTTGPVFVTPASTPAVAANRALVTRTVQLPTALAANGGMKMEGVVGGVAVPVSGTFFQAIQPVSGTVVADLPVINIASISVAESIAAPTAATWYIRKQWALPASAVVVPQRAFASATTNPGSRTLIAVINNLGNLNLSTNTFTAANSVASPFFYGRLFGCVTTVMSATADTLTVTYTDELGASSTSGAVVFAASSPVGNCFEFPLATGSPASALDSGARAVTNVTDTAAPTGVVTIYGVTTLLESLGTATTDFTMLDTGRLNANEQLAILLIQTLTTAQQRTAGLTVSIR